MKDKPHIINYKHFLIQSDCARYTTHHKKYAIYSNKKDSLHADDGASGSVV